MDGQAASFRLIAQSVPQALRGPAGVVGLIALCLAIVIAASLAAGHHVIVAGAVALVLLIFIALKSAFAVFALLWVLVPLLPRDARMLDVFIPDYTQLFVPALVLAMVLAPCRARGSGRVTVRAADAFVVAFLVCGYISNYMPYGNPLPKGYLLKIALPALMYFYVRFVVLTRRQFDTMLRLFVSAVSISAALMLVEGFMCKSIYEGDARYNANIYSPHGPFGATFTAASFLCYQPPFFLYALMRTRSKRWRWIYMFGWLLTVFAIFRTLERTQTTAVIVGFLVCISHSALRRSARPLLLLLPLCIAAGVLNPKVYRGLNRRYAGISDTAQSREVLRQRAIAYIQSDKWDPIFGTGMYVHDREFGSPDTDEEDAARIVPHNFYLTMALQYGMTGSGALLAIIVCAGLRAARLLRRRRERLKVNTALLTTLAAVAVTIAMVGWFFGLHGFYLQAIPWMLLGLLMGHEHLFVSEEVPSTGPPAPRGRAFDEPVPALDPEAGCS